MCKVSFLLFKNILWPKGVAILSVIMEILHLIMEVSWKSHGILFHIFCWNPGTCKSSGKTVLCQSIETEIGINFSSVNPIVNNESIIESSVTVH